MIWILALFGGLFIIFSIVIYKYIKSLHGFANKVFVNTQKKVVNNTKFKTTKRNIEVNGKEVFEIMLERLAQVNWERVIPKLLKYFFPAFIALIVFRSLTSTISETLANTTGQDTQTLTLLLDSMSGIFPLIVLLPLMFIVFKMLFVDRF